ncbi:MAG TPA: rhomboid family intramembrane serine protease [Chthoniobacterales bacterium]|nr:rhomboid family intramembrane serine protease [Chthoniobacterales bacterium]
MRLSGGKRSFYTRRLRERQQVVLPLLIGVNAIIFVAQLVVDLYQPGFVREYLGISNHGVSDAYAWQFLTAMFLYSGPWHFAANIFLLYLLGRDLESIVGSRHFFYLYFAGLSAGELGHLFLMPPNSMLLASSGGVTALIVAYALVLPELELLPSGSLFRSLRLKAKHLAYATIALALIFACVFRSGTLTHSAWLGGCAAGWLYAHLLGFGRPSFLQRFLQHRREQVHRYDRMTVEELIAQEIDPLLDKIGHSGFGKLSRRERRELLRAHAKLLEKQEVP